MWGETVGSYALEASQLVSDVVSTFVNPAKELIYVTQTSEMSHVLFKCVGQRYLFRDIDKPIFQFWS